MDTFKFFAKYTCFVAIVLLVFLGRIGLCSMDSADSPEVAVAGDRISVRAMGVPLGELLEAIEQETGIQFEVDEGILEEKIFVDLADLPLLEGIKRILFTLNNAIVYGPSGKILRVVLIGEGKASGMISTRKKGDDTSIIAQKQAPSNSKKAKIEGLPGAESVQHQAPPGSDITVIKGPPTEDIIKQKPPPGSDITVNKEPPEGELPSPMAPPDSTQPSGESKPPIKKGG